MPSSELQQVEQHLRDVNAANYEAWYVENKGVWFDYTERATAMTRLQVARHSTVLDVGCGTGRIATSLDARVIGIDFSVASLNVLRSHSARGQVLPIGGNALQLPLVDRSVDRVVSVQVIQHLPTHAERVQALAEMRRVLRPGGRMVLIAYRWGGAVKGKQADLFPNGLFRYAFSPGELGSLLSTAGFRRVHVGGMIHAGQFARLGWFGTQLDMLLGHLSILAQRGLYLCATGMR